MKAIVVLVALVLGVIVLAPVLLRTPAPPTVAAAPAAPATKPVVTAPAAPTVAPAAPPSAAAAVGVPVVAGNWEYTVVATRREKEIPFAVANPTGRTPYVLSTTSKATAKGEYLVVAVRVKNLGRENFGLNSHDFELYDGTGIKYRTSWVNAGEWAKSMGYDGQVGGDTMQLPPGVAGTYAVAFDVAPDAQGLKLRLVQPKVDVAL